MANVRIDNNGVPKGAVFELTAPAAHRTSVTAVDSSEPGSVASGVNADGYAHVDFDIDVTLGGTDPMVEDLIADLGGNLRAVLRDVLCGHLDPQLRRVADEMLETGSTPV